MTIDAKWNGVVIASSDDTILVEGNHYFPPHDVRMDHLEPSPTTTHCIWKGDASYYHVVVDGRRNADAAWYYPVPYDAASPIANYVAFWKGIEVTGTNPNEPAIPHPAAEAPSG
jgi:uncharacterized protein (DUF427 family)